MRLEQILATGAQDGRHVVGASVLEGFMKIGVPEREQERRWARARENLRQRLVQTQLPNSALAELTNE